MRSQLTDANITNIGGTWAADYAYHKSGNMSSRTINLAQETFNYTGHQMSNADGNSLSYDENGNLTAGVDVNMVWNWDNMLRSAEKAGDSISLRYDPSGNRIFKDVNDSGSTTTRKYIVDIVGDLPVILMDLQEQGQSYIIKKIYIYANSQILAQHDGNVSASRYFYLHDRLGSVRLMIDTSSPSIVKNRYAYRPFGELFASETSENVSNPFRFTGQYHDTEIDEYYLRARQYHPYIGRFTSRDPVFGLFEEPLTLHKYLYCGNDPTNCTDPSGQVTKEEVLVAVGGGTAMDAAAATAATALAIIAYHNFQELMQSVQFRNAVIDVITVGVEQDWDILVDIGLVSLSRQKRDRPAIRDWPPIPFSYKDKRSVPRIIRENDESMRGNRPSKGPPWLRWLRYILELINIHLGPPAGTG